ncbi:Regulatory protein RecX [bacterium HR08]|nr:Regulatory protein RecX [bacterium HR08]
MMASLYQQLMDRALRLLARKARSTAELRAKLMAKAPGQEPIVEQVLARLHELGYLNDRQLASDYAVARLQVKPMGRRRLREELRRKHLPEEAIESALDRAYDRMDEASLIARAVRKWVRIKGRPKTKADAKRLFDHLARLGFEYEHIRQAVREVSRAPLEED